MKIMETHVVESCVRGFHLQQDIWMLTTGKRLSCQMEDIIGHVPRKTSAVFSLFSFLHREEKER